MNELQIFNYESKEVRTVEVNGEVWFVAKDLCDTLGLENVSAAVNRLDEDEKLVLKLLISGQNRDSLVINESGAFSLILTSTKPEAKLVKKWITSEVLPSIRKTGYYGISNIEQIVAAEVKKQISAIAPKKYIPEKLSIKDMIIVEEKESYVIVIWHGEQYVATNSWGLYWNICLYRENGNHPLFKPGLNSKFKALEWIKRNL